MNRDKDNPSETGAEEPQQEKQNKGLVRDILDDVADDMKDAPSEDGQKPLSFIKTTAVAFVAAIAMFMGALVVYIVASGPNRASQATRTEAEVSRLSPDEALVLNVFYPVPGRVTVEKRLMRLTWDKRDIAEKVLREFLAGPRASEVSYVPEAVELLGVYLGDDNVLYVDLPSAMTMNFKGDALEEFLLLRAMYKSLHENIKGVNSFRLLVDGQEIDTVGGHIYIARGLERSVAYRLLEEDEVER